MNIRFISPARRYNSRTTVKYSGRETGVITKKKVLKVLSGLLVVTLFLALMLPGCGGSNCFTSLTDLAKMSPEDTQSILFVDFKKLLLKHLS